MKKTPDGDAGGKEMDVTRPRKGRITPEPFSCSHNRASKPVYLLELITVCGPGNSGCMMLPGIRTGATNR
ncbi:hypothetical protein Pmani_022219 [Petrolisthes manimaculis]|uniref:Uncharacterized protein n=1 Tax=Petrolisthes manimaculis TaxID=1843537 RepID=A0AAE1PCH6_9EUCA|nr:hypothetical protein Pmani_022219 [Petrolisthes manimaculis]